MEIINFETILLSACLTFLTGMLLWVIIRHLSKKSNSSHVYSILRPLNAASFVSELMRFCAENKINMGYDDLTDDPELRSIFLLEKNGHRLVLIVYPNLYQNVTRFKGQNNFFETITDLKIFALSYF